METKRDLVNISKLLEDLFNKQVKELERTLKTEILDFVKSNLKTKRRNVRGRGRGRGAKREPVPVTKHQDDAGPSQKPSVSLSCIAEHPEDTEANFAVPELPDRRPTSIRAAAKRATEVTSKQLKQSLNTKLRNPGTSESQGRNRSVLSPVKQEKDTNKSVGYEEQETVPLEVEVATKKCSVRLERSAELDNLVNGPSDQPDADSFINDSDMDVFKVPPVPLKKCKVTFQFSNSASQNKNKSTMNESNLVDHSGSQNNQKCLVSSSSSVNDKSSTNEVVCNNTTRESHTISISVTVESSSVNSADSDSNKRPVRTRTRNKKYNDEEFTTAFKSAVRASSLVNDKTVSNSTEANKGRGQKRKSDEANNKSAKIAKPNETEIPTIIISSSKENIQDNKGDVASNLVSSSIDLRPSTSKGVKSSVINHKTNLESTVSPIENIKSSKKQEPSLSLSPVQHKTSPVPSDNSRALNIPTSGSEIMSPQRKANKGIKSLEMKSPIIENTKIAPCNTEEVVVEPENQPTISAEHSPVASNSLAEVENVASSTLNDEKCASAEPDCESLLPSTSFQHSNNIPEQSHANHPIINQISPVFETPKPEPRMTRTRTREQNKNKMNDVLGVIPSGNTTVKKGKENKEFIRTVWGLTSEKKKLLTPQSSAKGPINIFSPLPKSHDKNASSVKHVMAPLSALEKKKELMKATTEQQRRKREEKEKRILLQRQAAEKEKQEKLVKALKEKSEKEKKAIAETQRLKEEQLRLKKLQHEAMIKEAEERRLKEEAVKSAHLKKLEEEKRKQAELRQKQADEARKMLEKRLQDKAKEESLAEAAKLKKIKALQNQAKTETYQLTPAKEDRLPLPPKSENDYGLDDEQTDDSDDDSAAPKKIIPKWASGNERSANALSQMLVTNEFIQGFFTLSSGWQLGMNKILDDTGFRNIVRRSSAVWNTPDTSFRF